MECGIQGRAEEPGSGVGTFRRVEGVLVKGIESAAG
jgi:hypothetical protein